MIHLDLFSGIGGFALAARWMEWQTVQFVEIDSFCQKVLNKNFPNIPIHGDIKTFNGEHLRGTIDILTGGFPCQPFSTAGKRKGTEDDRHLWPEMLRVIREVQPTYIVGENVYGFVNWNEGLVFDEVQTSLEAEGYEIAPVILPACSVNAPHKRDRVWIVAYSKSNNDRRTTREFCKENGGQIGALLSAFESPSYRLPKYGVTSNTCCERVWTSAERINVSRQLLQEAEWEESEFVGQQGQGRSERQISTTEDGNWKASWSYDDGRWPTQSPICGRNDGIFNRVDRIKSLGNAIVPQVAFEIFKAIEAVDNKIKTGLVK